VQCPTGSIPAFNVPHGYREGELRDIIVTTDGLGIFGVGYHGWIIATRDEHILLCGGGDDGQADLMSSYHSELDGISAGLATLGTLYRSGRLNIRSVWFICNNESAILTAKMPITNSIYFNTKDNWDLIATSLDLLDNWCNDMDIKFYWVKGHADLLNRPLSRDEWLNMVVDRHVDDTRSTARIPAVARSLCTHWNIEIASLSLRGGKVTSQYTDQLKTQLHKKS
jgi:hypothetical protein